jgi:hypothetical protein
VDRVKIISIVESDSSRRGLSSALNALFQTFQMCSHYVRVCHTCAADFLNAAGLEFDQIDTIVEGALLVESLILTDTELK